MISASAKACEHIYNESSDSVKAILDGVASAIESAQEGEIDYDVTNIEENHVSVMREYLKIYGYSYHISGDNLKIIW